MITGAWHILHALVFAIGSCVVAAAAMAQIGSTGIGSDASEERVKAAYLYRFPNYVEWPASAFTKPDTPYVIGVLGDNNIVDELSRISAGRLINNRPVNVKKLQEGDVPSGIHVLFIGRSERARLSQLAKQANGKPMLIVTETDGALTQGSMINFRIADDRVRFEVSLEPAEKAELKLSARLLALALSVTRGSQK
jgi:L-arabinose isomerase